MSFKLSEDQVGFKRHSYPQNAEINVTPFVDVILVLLVIFMIAAPLATVTVPVELPHNAAAPSPPPVPPLTVTMQEDGAIYIGTTKTDLADLVPALTAAAHGNFNTDIFLRGDKHLQYGQLMDVMSQLSAGGFAKVGLIAEQSGQN